MKKLNINEMKNIKGNGISGSLINAFRNGIISISDIGRYLGSSIRRLIEKNMCRY